MAKTTAAVGKFWNEFGGIDRRRSLRQTYPYSLRLADQDYGSRCSLLTWSVGYKVRRVLLMSVGPAYVGSSASGSASGSNWLDLRVVCLNGEGCILTLNPSTMGWEVRKMVAEIIPRKRVQPGLHHLAAPLMLDRTLQEQGIVGTDTILHLHSSSFWGCMEFCPRIPNLGGWLCIGRGDWDRSKHLRWIFTSSSESLESLTFGDRFNQGLEQVTLPKNLRSLTFGCDFNQSLAQVALPNSLRNLPFGSDFNESLERVTLPDGLQSLTFGSGFKQSLERVILPSNLQSLNFGARFNQSLERVILGDALQSLTFGDRFNRRLCDVAK